MNHDLTLRERFWAKVAMDDGCWIWSGARTGRGRTLYGKIAVREGVFVGAHRVMWELMRGSIPPGMCVLHSCDNPPCVNIAHLSLGTHADNSAEKVARGRHVCGYAVRMRRGAPHPSAKLTDEQVAEIRDSSERGVVLAKKHGLSPNYVYAIRRGRARFSKEGTP